jgi:hypothetical protein
MPRDRRPRLPSLLDRKIYKTGQTRGAEDDEIYQNRVSRQSTVLIPYPMRKVCGVSANVAVTYEKGFIVLISPEEYFGFRNATEMLKADGLELGKNCLVFYETRSQWNASNPELLKWTPATQRNDDLGGQYVARVSATTSTDTGEKINRGFTTTSMKGAGIRVYEYASTEVNEQCRLQLESLFWLCPDSDDVVLANGMNAADRDARKQEILNRSKADGLLDFGRLQKARATNSLGVPICPLCLEELSSKGFFSRMEQAAGREVHDLTVTQVSLFHINELRYGLLNHCPYNVAWGHHHCNVVVKDSGIDETLRWLKSVVDTNIKKGLFPS